MNNPEIYDGREGRPWLTPTKYHESKRISRSQLAEAAYKTPAHYKAAREASKIPTRGLIRGDAIHAAVLEPERFRLQYVFPPTDVDRRTKVGKEDWAFFLADAEDKAQTIIGWDPVEKKLYKDDSAAVRGIAQGLAKNEGLRAVLQGEGLTEPSYFWSDDGLDFRCRLDRVNRSESLGTILIDLKSTRDASRYAFRYTVEQLHYHFQMAFYADGYEAATGDQVDECVLVAYETEPPYAAAVYPVSPVYIGYGREEYRRAAQKVRECTESGEWPDWSAAGAQELVPSRRFMEERENG